MLTLDFLDCVARFQTLIAGVLVLFGVIVTLYFNACIARNERHESLKLEQQAIRTALIEELKIVKIGLVDVAEKIENHEGAWGAILLPSGTISDVYKTLLPRIGLLTSIQVEKVLFAYMTAFQFRENLTLLQSDVLLEHHVQISQEEFGAIGGSLINLIPHIDEAILSLSEPYIAGTK